MPSLIALSIGPIQEFIAAARRTKDLFAGSKLLSELSKAAAKSIKDSGAILVFPSPNCELEYNSKDLIANIILAQVDGDPQAALEKAKEATKKFWTTLAKTVFEQFEPNQVIRKDIWDSQVDSVLELYGAWVKIDDQDKSGRSAYQNARDSLMRLMAGRKALRNFDSCKAFTGIPKSSLDGQRDSVLQNDNKRKGWSIKAKRILRAKKGEQLDCVGVIKRAWEGSTQVFPSVSRIAADAWIRKIHCDSPHLLQEFITTCEELKKAGEIDLPKLTGKDFERYSLFPLEGSALYPGRHKDLIDDNDDQSILDPLKDAFEKLSKKFKEPSPYVAILIADGDKMGEVLSKIKTLKGHQEISENLNAFAMGAKNIVEKSQGTLIYSGGDDVLAILPVDHCLECAKELSERFNTELKKNLPGDISVPTLSVGIAIGHSIEDLEDLLNYARDAEKHAKTAQEGEGTDRQEGEGTDRNGLAVHIHKRGGGPVKVRGNWDSLYNSLIELSGFINKKELSSKFANELIVLARHYEKWPDKASTTEEAIQKDTTRVLNKKEGSAAKNSNFRSIIFKLKNSREIQNLAERILVARQIAEGKRQSQVKKKTEGQH